MPGQTVQTQIRLRSSLIRVYTVCHSVCIVWTHYFIVEPHSSNFRVITTKFLGVRIFRKFTVYKVLLLRSRIFQRSPCLVVEKMKMMIYLVVEVPRNLLQNKKLNLSQLRQSPTKHPQAIMFGSPSPEKDLFATSEKPKKPDVPKNEEKPKTVPAAIKTEPVSSKSDSLFGSPSPDKGLFGSPVEPKKTDIPKSKSEPVQIKPENKPKPDNLFGSLSPEEDLFSAPVKPKKPVTREPEQTGSRKIAGDGDLFGPPDITEKPDKQKKVKDPFLDDEDDDDLFSAAETKKRQESLLETDEELQQEVLYFVVILT